MWLDKVSTVRALIRKVPEFPQTGRATVTAMTCTSELCGETRLLKMTHALVAELRKIKVWWNWIVPRGFMLAAWLCARQGACSCPGGVTAFWFDFRATPQAGTSVRYCKPGVKPMGKESQVSVGKQLLLFCWVGVTLSNCLLHICALPIGHCFCQLQSAKGGNFLFTVVYHKAS